MHSFLQNPWALTFAIVAGWCISVVAIVAWFASRARDQRTADLLIASQPIVHAPASSVLCDRCLHPTSDVGLLFPTPIPLHAGYAFTMELCASCRELIEARPLSLVRAEDLTPFEIPAPHVLAFPSRETAASQGMVS